MILLIYEFGKCSTASELTTMMKIGEQQGVLEVFRWNDQHDIIETYDGDTWKVVEEGTDWN